MLVSFLGKKRLLVLVIKAFEFARLTFKVSLEFDQGILYFPKHVAAVFTRTRRKKARDLADKVTLQRFCTCKLYNKKFTLFAAVFYLLSR